MKIEKVNENQIRCILSKEDLADRQIKLSELAYGSEKAKMLLETTDIPIKEISDSLGFYDTAYFYKTFMKAIKITPKEYRKTVKPNY